MLVTKKAYPERLIDNYGRPHISCHWWLSIFAENIRKSLIFLCLQGVYKEAKSIKRV